MLHLATILHLQNNHRVHRNASIHGYFVACLATIVCVSLGVLLSGCGPETHPTSTALPWPTDNVLTLNLQKEPPTLDPLRMTDSVSGRILHEIMNGLTDFDAESNVVPAVASHWDISADRLTYTFHLRRDAFWSDGKPVTAQDFRYAFQRVLTQANGCSYAFFLYAVKGAEDFFNQKIKSFDQVGIHVIDPHTLRFQLRKPNGFFPSMLAFQVLAPLREDNIQTHGEQFTEAGKFITNGPYTLARWDHDSRIILKPNPRFYDGKASQRPTLQYEMIPDQNTAMTLFNQGVLDMADSLTVIPNTEYAHYAKNPRAKEIGISFIQYLGFNTRIKPFDDVNVRRAFCQCIQRDYFTTLLKGGENPIQGFITPGLFGYNPKRGLSYAPEKAKQMWQAYAASHPDVSPPTLMYSNDYGIRKTAEILQYQWQQTLGVRPSLRALDWKVYLSRLKYDTPALYLLGWFVDYPDPDSFLSLFHSTNGNNHTGWASSTYDALLEQGASLPNGLERQKVYDAAQKTLLEEHAIICPLYRRNKLWVTHPWVKGLSFSSMNDLVLEDVQILRPSR
jgi:oligopeptide transport system substrate-binding protein